jgi:hypothetical protein
LAIKKVKNPQRFSALFHLSPATLALQGAFDPILNADTRLFIDPLLLAGSKHPEMRAAYDDWCAHFLKILRLLRVSKSGNDVPAREVQRLFTSTEFKGTCLGYGSGSIDGSGIGAGLRDRLIATAREIVELGVDDPSMFAMLPLLEEDIGPDRISDLTTRVIGFRLAAFTVRILANDVPNRVEFNFGGQTFRLPVNPLVRDRGSPLPVVLVPEDVLRDLPIASDWRDIARVSTENEETRRSVNQEIGSIWATRTSKEKKENRALALSSREAFEALMKAVASLPKVPYDVRTDPEGWVNWLEVGRALGGAHPLQLAKPAVSLAGIKKVVEEIIDQYQLLIEVNDVWKSLYGPGGKILHEGYAQRIFFVLADTYCRANNIGIDPEANSGGGPVDFKFSSGYDARVVVEIKLSRNSKLFAGYTKQLKSYQRSQRDAAGYYVILDVGRGDKQVEEVLQRETNDRNAGRNPCPVTVIDGKRKRSASKL